MKLTTQKTNNINRTRLFDEDKHIITIEHYAKTQYEQSVIEDHIVKAVNSHEELKHALKLAIECLDKYPSIKDIDFDVAYGIGKEALKSCE